MTQPAYVADDPTTYERQMGRWSGRLAASFINFARIGAAASILDVGCGTGSLAFALARAAPKARITGVDLSEAFVAHARSLIPDARVTFERGDAAALPYGDGAFDAVASLLVLNSVPEAGRAVREMARVARPGGTVAAAVWDFRGGLTFLRVLLDTAALLDPDGEAFRARVCSFPLTAPGELGAAWAEAGLREVEETSLTVRVEFGSFADYREPWLGGQGTVGAYVAGRAARADRAPPPARLPRRRRGRAALVRRHRLGGPGHQVTAHAGGREAAAPPTDAPPSRAL